MKLTQQKQLLNALMEAKEAGINSYFATYSMRIKQAPTRIQELQEQGYNITSIKNKDRSVNWILTTPSNQIVEPQYTWDFSTGIARRVLVNQKPEQEVLFNG